MLERFLVYQQNLDSVVQNVSVSRRSPPLPATSSTYIKQLSTILIAVDYIELEGVDPHLRRTGRAAIAAHPVATREVCQVTNNMSGVGCDNFGQGSTDQTE
jgi:hypothetical protein